MQSAAEASDLFLEACARISGIELLERVQLHSDIGDVMQGTPAPMQQPPEWQHRCGVGLCGSASRAADGHKELHRHKDRLCEHGHCITRSEQELGYSVIHCMSAITYGNLLLGSLAYDQERGKRSDNCTEKCTRRCSHHYFSEPKQACTDRQDSHYSKFSQACVGIDIKTLHLQLNIASKLICLPCLSMMYSRPAAHCPKHHGNKAGQDLLDSWALDAPHPPPAAAKAA